MRLNRHPWLNGAPKTNNHGFASLLYPHTSHKKERDDLYHLARIGMFGLPEGQHANKYFYRISLHPFYVVTGDALETK